MNNHQNKETHEGHPNISGGLPQEGDIERA